MLPLHSGILAKAISILKTEYQTHEVSPCWHFTSLTVQHHWVHKARNVWVTVTPISGLVRHSLALLRFSWSIGSTWNNPFRPSASPIIGLRQQFHNMRRIGGLKFFPPGNWTGTFPAVRYFKPKSEIVSNIL